MAIHKKLFFILNLLVATCTFYAIAPTSALAVKKGEFVQAGTTEKVKGKITFTAKGSQVFETKAGIKVSCASMSGEALAASTMLMEPLTMRFKGCKISTGGSCHSSGAEAGEIVVGGVTVYWVDEGFDQVMVTTLFELLFSSEFECLGLKVKLEKGGQFLAEPLSESKAKEFTLVAKCTSGIQELNEYQDTNELPTKVETKKTIALKLKFGEGVFEESCMSGEVGVALAEGEAEFI